MVRAITRVAISGIIFCTKQGIVMLAFYKQIIQKDIEWHVLIEKSVKLANHPNRVVKYCIKVFFQQLLDYLDNNIEKNIYN